jgi:drug/metabolite transporter (DMT)-like permease
MVWPLFAILSALFNALYYAAIKGLSKDGLSFAPPLFLISSFITFIISIVKGIPPVKDGFWIWVLLAGVLDIAAFLLYLNALKSCDLSLCLPILSFTPIFLIGTSFIILKELPTPFGAGGVALVVAGSYVLTAKRILEPFKGLLINRGILYMLMVSFIFSLGANFAKMVVQASDPVFGAAVIYIFLSISLFAIDRFRVSLKQFKNPKVILGGTAAAFSSVCINTSLAIEIVPYCISLKRLSVLFSVFIGGLFFKEGNTFQRAVAASIMVLGTTVIILA